MSTFAVEPARKNDPFASQPQQAKGAPAPVSAPPPHPLSGLGTGGPASSQGAGEVYTGMYDGPQKQPERRGKGVGDEPAGGGAADDRVAQTACDDIGSLASDINGSLGPLEEMLDLAGRSTQEIRAVRRHLGTLSTVCDAVDAVEQLQQARDAFAAAASTDSAVARCDAYQQALEALSSCAGLLPGCVAELLSEAAGTAAEIVGGFREYAEYLDDGIEQTGLDCFGGAADANGNAIPRPAHCD
jgi:hypothetical protein